MAPITNQMAQNDVYHEVDDPLPPGDDLDDHRWLEELNFFHVQAADVAASLDETMNAEGEEKNMDLGEHIELWS